MSAAGIAEVLDRVAKWVDERVARQELTVPGAQIFCKLRNSTPGTDQQGGKARQSRRAV